MTRRSRPPSFSEFGPPSRRIASPPPPDLPIEAATADAPRYQLPPTTEQPGSALPADPIRDEEDLPTDATSAEEPPSYLTDGFSGEVATADIDRLKYFRVTSGTIAGVPVDISPAMVHTVAADVREKYNLQGSCTGDLVKSFCCLCCSVVQAEKEARDREAERGPVKHQYGGETMVMQGGQQPQQH